MATHTTAQVNIMAFNVEKAMEETLEKIATLMQERDEITEGYDDQIETLKGYLSRLMGTSDLENYQGKSATAFFGKRKDVKVADWAAVMKFVSDNCAFDILQKRISPDALATRISAGAVIPGVSITTVETFNIRSNKHDN